MPLHRTTRGSFVFGGGFHVEARNGNIYTFAGDPFFRGDLFSPAISFWNTARSYPGNADRVPARSSRSGDWVSTG